MHECKTVTLRTRPLKEQDAVFLLGLLSGVSRQRDNESYPAMSRLVFTYMPIRETSENRTSTR